MKLPRVLTSNFPPLWRILLTSSLLYLVFYLYNKTAFSQFVENRVSLPALFSVRDMYEQSPPISPQLKLFSFDDTTLGSLGKADLSNREWAAVLKAIAERKPRAIYIDKLFALNSATAEEFEVAAADFRSISTPIISISFVAPKELQSRAEFPLSDARYHLLSMYPSKVAMMTSSFIPMLERSGWKVYASHQALQPFFNRVGHAHNADYGKADPLINMGAGRVLPHVALVGPFNLSVRGKQLYAGSQRIPTDSQGKVVVNFFTRSDFMKKNTRILNLLNKIRGGKAFSEIDEGDTVLILPSMFTGGTDFVRTPLGPMPGGYVIASLINSMLTNRWIDPVQWDNWSVLVACFLGVPVVVAVGNLFWVYLIGCVVLYGIAAISFFTWQGILVNVSVPVGAFLTSVMVSVMFRNKVREKLMFFLRVLKTENEELRSEIDQATQIAKVFNPDSAPNWGALKVSSFHQTLIAASGDWHAFEESPSGKFKHVLMCDITGHGIQAAIIVSACKTVLSMVTQKFPETLERLDFFSVFMQMLNSTLFAQGRGHHITTFVGISIDLSAQKLSYITAGHPPPLLFRKNENKEISVRSLNSRHNPLGVFPEVSPHCLQVDIIPGDLIAIYTDGVQLPRNSRCLYPLVEELTTDGLDEDSAANFAKKVRDFGVESDRPVLPDDVSLVLIHWQ